MILHYLYEGLIYNNLDDPKELFRILAYIERSTALDTVSFVLDLVSEARKKGLSLEDVEHAISDLYSSLEAEKQILIQNDPAFSLAEYVLERAEKRRKRKEEESKQ